MWDEIEKKGRRYDELKRLIENPAGPGNPQYAAWLREYGRLGKFGELWEPLSRARTQLAEAEAILQAPEGDAAWKALAREEAENPARKSNPPAPRWWNCTSTMMKTPAAT